MNSPDGWRVALDRLLGFKQEMSDRRTSLLAYFHRHRQRLDAREEANLLRQLSLMVESGIGFSEALDILQKSGQGRGANLARDLADSLYRGLPLSRAFWLHQDRLSEVTPALVEAGEACGGLTRTMQIAADWSDLAADLKAKITSAMIYPAFVVLMNLVLTGLMLGYVFPAFIPLFQGEQLPLLTRFFLGCSGLASSKLFWVVALLCLIEVALFFSQPEHQEKLHRFCLLLPVLSPLLRAAARTRFCAVVAVTTRTGLPVLKALTLAAKASGDPDFVALDSSLQRDVREGAPLEDHFLSHSDTYGLSLSHGMALCQATGNTDLVCGHLTTLFQQETETRVQQIQSLMEPVLIALVSATTAVLLLSIYLPLGRFLHNLMA